MKVCPLTRISSLAPEICLASEICSPYRGYLLHRKNIPLLQRPNRIHGRSGRQHPSGILGVYDRSGVCNAPHYCQTLFLYDQVLGFC